MMFGNQSLSRARQVIAAALASAMLAPAARAGPGPVNDTCAAALPIVIVPGGQTVISASSAAAAIDPGLPACGMDPPRDSGSAGVWYFFVGTGNRMSIDTCSGPSLDLVLRVFCGSCAGPVCAAADDDGCDGSTTLNPRLALCTAPAATYLVLLSRSSTGAGGPFVLTVTDSGAPCPPPPSCGPTPPANDSCAGALPIAIGGGVTGTTIDATADAAPACAGATVRRALWYTFTGNGRLVQASTCNPITGSNTSIAAYSGSCAALACVAGSATAATCPDRADAAATATFCAAAGTTYFIAVSDEADGAGLFQLSLSDLASAPCSTTGACCTNGFCTISTLASCAGAYLGDGSVCSPGASPLLPIPDNDAAGAASTIVITQSAGPITDLNVGFIISHTWQGDLKVTLQHDAGPEVVLVDRPGYPLTAFGFSADNFGNPNTGTPFVADDQAAHTYDAPYVGILGNNNPTGGWLPDPGPLSLFNGQSLAGLWTLRVRDLAAGDTGTLRSWTLIPTPPAPAQCPPGGPDCFSRLVAGQPPQNAGHFTRGLPDGLNDNVQCIGDWDRNGALQPSDVADYVGSWFYSATNPGNLDADIDCSGSVVPADVAVFVQHWFTGLQSPASEGC